MLTTKQKSFLKSEAHHLAPIFQVGKGGVSDAMLVQIKEALEKRELVKISILQNNEDGKDEVAVALAKGTKSQLVQLIGHTVVLYKQSVHNKRIELPVKR
ncbi:MULTISPECIES: ribosome assembly RNA-binding protein YhbY [Planococcus]|uniref:RNA-binding protein n=2 Tax=Planococcus TaxID=1372 RepID=A0ABM5WX58_9BACL|nr:MULTISPECIES: ribosome assembly RNA-binding protein YhbY [Planococcus]ALS78928.1 RNA-binding protein [Planococcus kocurii]AQU79114.1 RNA-binding protein [Planococcus faecalis]KAA0957794.1 ribosome assembly RNA-binding protein YhbY [Planococcus sp. ANT_H30]MDJ0331056.1 ribosome assembly RNA-binding protein YhbY [Planococcus sp. S3-L1]OHX51750.1 RNA-binding protein [Planococcus faecalis]